MPAVYFSIRWPNGQEQQCYSPSTVIHDYYKEGESMSLGEFTDRARIALTLASQRVEEKFGYACSSASDQLKEINHQAAKFEDPNGTVEIISLCKK